MISCFVNYTQRFRSLLRYAPISVRFQLFMIFLSVFQIQYCRQHILTNHFPNIKLLKCNSNMFCYFIQRHLWSVCKVLHEINTLSTLLKMTTKKEKYQSINKTNKKFQIIMQPYGGPGYVNTFPFFIFLISLFHMQSFSGHFLTN